MGQNLGSSLPCIERAVYLLASYWATTLKTDCGSGDGRTPLLPAAVSPRQVMQLQHAEQQRDPRHGQHEHDEDVLLRRPGHVAVDGVRARRGLGGGGAPCYIAAFKTMILSFASVVTHLADVEGVEEDSVQEVLQRQEDHLWVEGGGANHSQQVCDENSEAKQKVNEQENILEKNFLGESVEQRHSAKVQITCL